MASRSTTLRNTDPKKVSGELFILTYGGLVSTLLRDYENVDDVNKQVSNFHYPVYVNNYIHKYLTPYTNTFTKQWC